MFDNARQDVCAFAVVFSIADTSRLITMALWEGEFDPMGGAILHEARAGTEISSG
jgi:hypothetical protein